MNRSELRRAARPPRLCTLQVDATPAGASLRVESLDHTMSPGDAAVHCLTPALLRLPPGRYRLQLSHPGFAPWQRELVLAPTALAQPVYAALAALPAPLEIRSEWPTLADALARLDTGRN